MKRLIKIFVSIGMVSTILALTLSCIPTTGSVNDTGNKELNPSEMVYNRTAACNYAQKYGTKVCSDGYFWVTSTDCEPKPAGSDISTLSGDDCAHFVSCCIGLETHEQGGGINLPLSFKSYGEPGALNLVNWLLTNGYANKVTSVDQLEPGDIIYYQWSSATGDDHVALYLGNGNVASHTYSTNNSPWQLGEQAYNYLFIHILNSLTSTPISSASASAGTLGTTIQYGQTVTGQIASVHDSQNWKFYGQEGDVITIHTVDDGGASLQPALALLDPSGKNITGDSNNWGNSEAWIKNYTLIFSGIYTINVFGDENYYNPTTGGFKVTLTLKAPIANIVYGQQVTGQIAFTYDYQDWKFSGQAGDIITIHMVDDGGASLQPAIALLDPSGKNVTSDSNSGGNSEAWIKNYTLAFSGIYTINAFGDGNYYNPTTGGFKVTLTLKAPVATIICGQQVTGQIAFTYDYQDWKFSGQAGDIITIHMFDDGGASLQPAMALLDPSGKNLISDSNSSGGSEAWIKNYTLLFSGIYTINAFGDGNYYNPTTGGFKLSLNKK